MAASYAIVSGVLPHTVGGYTDFTSSGFGTPAAAFIFSTFSAPGGSVNIRSSFGFWDGTNQRTCAISDLDNRADADTARCSDDSYGLCMSVTFNVGEDWFTVSNTTDGIRITLSVEDYDIGVVSLYATVVLFSGINAKVLTFTPNSTQNSTQESESLGFAPKLLLFTTIGSTTADTTSSDHCILSLGFAEIGGTHRNIRWYSLDSAANMDYRLKFDENRCVGEENSWALEITTWGSDTFTATTRDAANGGDVTFCLALGGADLLYDVGTLTTLTSTGDSVISTTNTPDTALICLSTATGTTRHTDSGANGFMVGVGKGTAEYCHNFSGEDAAATSNCASEYQSAQILDLDSSAAGTTTDLCDATVVLNTSDITLTYSAVDATARKGWYIIFGQPVAATGQPTSKRFGGIPFASKNSQSLYRW